MPDSKSRPSDNPDATTAPQSPPPATGTSSDTLGGSPATAPTPPTRIGGYTIHGQLGRGGMGVVYRAEDTGLKREVALKVMLPEFAANPQAKSRFLREACAQAKVEHDHVAVIHQVSEHNGVPYLVMPLLKGMTLQAALKANPRPPLAEVIRIGREVAEGLAAAHEKGLVHRDIKPANVWLEGKKLRVRILDFGLARPVDAEATPEDGPVTREGAVVGTPAYMSPEQGRGLSVDGRTDLFSLGVMLYQMTTGELPFRGANTLAVLTALAVDTPPCPIAKNPSVPPSLSELVMRLLSKNPDGRPASAEAVAEELRAIETGRVNAVRVIPLDAPPPIILSQSEPDPFADLDATEASAAEAEPERAGGSGRAGSVSDRSSRRSGFPVWAIALGVLLTVAVIVGAVVSQIGKKSQPEVAKEEDPPPREKEKPPVTPKKNNTDAVKKAVAWVLSNGGKVSAGSLGALQAVTSPDAISGTVLEVRFDRVASNDPSLENLRAFQELQTLVLAGWPITDAGLKTLAGMPLAKSLTAFGATVTNLTGAGLDHLAAFPNLELLIISSNPGFSPEGLVKLRKLSKLQRLNLGGCALTDSHLTSLKDLPLTWLCLETNKELTNRGLTNLGSMPSLKELIIDGTGITDDGLKTVAEKMPNLAFLTLSELSPVTNTGIDHLRKMQLHRITIDKSKLTPETVLPLPRCELVIAGKTIEPSDVHFREARRLLERGGFTIRLKLPDRKEASPKSATELPDGPFTLVEISGSLNDDDLRRLVATPTLTGVAAASARITDDGLRSLTASKATLRDVYLFDIPLTDDGLRSISECPNMEQLNVSGSKITDDGLKHLAGLTRLRMLFVGSTAITDAGLKHLVDFPALVHLGLLDTCVSDAGAETLATMKGLQRLSLQNTRITQTGLDKLRAALPNCKIDWEDPNRSVAKWLFERGGFEMVVRTPDGRQLAVKRPEELPPGPFLVITVAKNVGPAAFNDADLTPLAALTGLSGLYLHGNQLTDAGLRPLVHLKETLTELNLAHGQFGDEGMKVLGELTKLGSLHVSGNKLTDAGLGHLTALPGLGTLALQGTGVTDAGLKHLPAMKGLHTLNLGGTAVSDIGAETLAGMKSLKVLNLKDTRITAEGLKKLQAALPDCKIEWEEPKKP